MRSRSLLAAAVALALVVPAGCGGDGGDETAGAGQTTTIKGKLGTATISGTPKRVAALDNQSADAALALGVKPVVIPRVDYTEPGVLPWTRTALDGEKPRQINPIDISVEDVAAARPDVILAVGSSDVAKVYDQLERVAPVVSYAEGPVEGTWQEGTTRVGKALGRERQAAEEVRAVEGRLRTTKAEAGLNGKTISFFNFVKQPFLVKEPRDASVRFFAGLGMRPPAQARALPQAAGRRTEVSPEQLDLLEADLIVSTSPDPASLRAFAKRPVFQRLRAVREGHYTQITIEQAVSMAFPSALSIDWALKNVVPALSKTAS